jgi:hypothetical protein
MRGGNLTKAGRCCMAALPALDATVDAVFVQLQNLLKQRHDELRPRPPCKRFVITVDELIRAARKLARGAAPGPSGWNNNDILILCADYGTAGYLCQLCEQLVNNEAPPVVQEWFKARIVTALDKGGGKPRPITPEEVWLKLIWLIVQHRNKAVIRRTLGKEQYGLTGCEHLLRDFAALQKRFEARKGKLPDIFTLDATNAYGEIDINVFLEEIATNPALQDLVAPAFLILGAGQHFYVVDPKTQKLRLLVHNKTCLPQGSSPAPLAFSLTTLSALKRINLAINYTESKYPDFDVIPDKILPAPPDYAPNVDDGQLHGRIFTYLDDISGIVRPGWYHIVYKFIEEEMKPLHIRFNNKRGQLFDTPEARNNAIKILGVPIYYGRDSTAAFATAADGSKVVNRDGAAYIMLRDDFDKKIVPWLKNMHHADWQKFPAEATNILQVCGNGKMSYLARNVEPALLRDLAHRYDEMVQAAALPKLGIQPHRTDPTWWRQLLYLPHKFGGLGFTSVVHLLDYAFDCNRRGTKQLVRKQATDKARYEQLVRDVQEKSVTCRATVNGAPIEERNVEAINLLARLTSPIKGTHFVLTALLPPTVWYCAMAQRFATSLSGVPPTAACALCSRMLSDCDHHLKCDGHKGSRTQRHQNVLSVLNTHLRGWGHHVATSGETSTGTVAAVSSKRFDQVITVYGSEARLATDISVALTDPLERHAEKVKKYKEDLAQPQWSGTSFHPLVCTTSGDITDHMRQFILVLARTRSTSDPTKAIIGATAAAVRTVRKELVLSIHRDQAAMYLACLGMNNIPPQCLLAPLGARRPF